MNAEEKPVNLPPALPYSRIDDTELYKLIFAEHRYAVDLRERILKGWGYVYLALGAGFVWLESGPGTGGVGSGREVFSWLVGLGGVLATWFFWKFEVRNRDGIVSAKRAAREIEQRLIERKDERFFESVFPYLPTPGFRPAVMGHSEVIDRVAPWLMGFWIVFTLGMLLRLWWNASGGFFVA